MAKEDKEPVKVWGYRSKDGQIESRIFDDKIPSGWTDTPAKLKDK